MIGWLRRDLRLRDNRALAMAVVQGEGVVPAFVLDPALQKLAPAIGFSA